MERFSKSYRAVATIFYDSTLLYNGGIILLMIGERSSNEFENDLETIINFRRTNCSVYLNENQLIVETRDGDELIVPLVLAEISIYKDGGTKPLVGLITTVTMALLMSMFSYPTLGLSFVPLSAYLLYEWSKRRNEYVLEVVAGSRKINLRSKSPDTLKSLRRMILSAKESIIDYSSEINREEFVEFR